MFTQVICEVGDVYENYGNVTKILGGFSYMQKLQKANLVNRIRYTRLTVHPAIDEMSMTLKNIQQEL